jgi:hypothetical protein
LGPILGASVSIVKYGREASLQAVLCDGSFSACCSKVSRTFLTSSGMKHAQREMRG